MVWNLINALFFKALLTNGLNFCYWPSMNQLFLDITKQWLSILLFQWHILVSILMLRKLPFLFQRGEVEIASWRQDPKVCRNKAHSTNHILLKCSTCSQTFSCKTGLLRCGSKPSKIFRYPNSIGVWFSWLSEHENHQHYMRNLESKVRKHSCKLCTCNSLLGLRLTQ